MTAERDQAVLDEINADISKMSEHEQAEVRRTAETIMGIVMLHGEAGLMALGLVGATVTVVASADD